MKIKIDEKLKTYLPSFSILAFTFEYDGYINNALKERVRKEETKIREEYSLPEVLNIPLIKTGRDSYKKLKKDPSHTRLASEALLRRIVKGMNLYAVNPLVDTGNLLSIILFRPTAVFDMEKINGDILIRLGRESDEYTGIGRGKINVDNIPVYEDATGPFGSTTSDTERTMITIKSKKILFFVIKFDNQIDKDIIALVKKTYTKYCDVKNIKYFKVS